MYENNAEDVSCSNIESYVYFNILEGKFKLLIKVSKMAFFTAQNVNVARFARNVLWDFFCDFQTPCDVENPIWAWETNKLKR